MSKELKPCPFCGSKDIEEGFEPIGGYGYIVCNAEKSGCGATSGRYESYDEAAESWNRRTTP